MEKKYKKEGKKTEHGKLSLLQSRRPTGALYALIVLTCVVPSGGSVMLASSRHRVMISVAVL